MKGPQIIVYKITTKTRKSQLPQSWSGPIHCGWSWMLRPALPLPQLFEKSRVQDPGCIQRFSKISSSDASLLYNYTATPSAEGLKGLGNPQLTQIWSNLIRKSINKKYHTSIFWSDTSLILWSMHRIPMPIYSGIQCTVLLAWWPALLLSIWLTIKKKISVNGPHLLIIRGWGVPILSSTRVSFIVHCHLSSWGESITFLSLGHSRSTEVEV